MEIMPGDTPLTPEQLAYRKRFLDMLLSVARRGSRAHAQWEAGWYEANNPWVFTGFQAEFTKAFAELRARVAAEKGAQGLGGAIPAAGEGVLA